jgi:hypothetical protein
MEVRIPASGMELLPFRRHVRTHLTGGLRGLGTEEGILLFPILLNGELHATGNFSAEEFNELYTSLNLNVFGTEEIIEQNDIVTSLRHDLSNDFDFGKRPEDHWNMIFKAACYMGDQKYSDLAKFFAISIRNAGICLRNTSNELHNQLVYAFNQNFRDGTRFAHLSQIDLQVSCHSLLVGMCSARDYLSSIAGIHVGARPNIDSLPRLVKWLRNKPNSEVFRDPLVSELLSADGQGGQLIELGSLRIKLFTNNP